MKLVKILSLASAAAIAALAFIGSPSALANSEYLVLCEKPELVCENPWPNPTIINLHAENPSLLTSIGTIECESSDAKVSMLNELAKLVEAHTLEYSITGNCHLGATSCTVTVTKTGALSFEKTGPLKASALVIPLELEGGEKDYTTAVVKCGFFINCTYEGEPLLQAVNLSAETGTLALIANEAPLTKIKGICPELSLWDAEYIAVEDEEVKLEECGEEKTDINKVPATGLYIES